MLNTIYIKTAIRHLLKHKMHSVINISGLTIAFSCALLVFLFVQYELSYDSYHKNADQLYRVIKEDLENEWRGTNMWNATSGLLKPTILENFPEVTNGVRTLRIREVEIERDRQHFIEEDMSFVEPQFFELFTYEFVKGDPATAINQPRNLVLTESMSRKYFGGDTEAIGQSLLVSGIDFTITGVIRDIPGNSHFPITFLGSYQTLFDPSYRLYDTQLEWNNNNYNTYIQLQKDAKPQILERKISQVIDEIRGGDSGEKYHLQNIQDIHLHSHVNLEADTNGNILYVNIFIGIAILLLIIGGFNYMNLTSAQLLFFAREAGIRKVIGARRIHVLIQILTGSTILSLLSLGISVLVASLLLPLFNQLAERPLAIDELLSTRMILYWILLAICYAIFTSLYPAIQVMRQNPIKTIKSDKITSQQAIGTRNTLVVLQFAISMVLIGGTIVLYQQLNFVKNKELGFLKESIINIQIPEMNSELKRNSGILRNELESIPEVLDVTYAQTALDKINWGGQAEWSEMPPELEIPIYHLIVDNNYLNFYDIEVLYGNSFTQEMKTRGRSSYFLLNEAAVKAIGWADPINKALSVQMWSNSRVIGVVKDFHFQPLHLGIEPLVISLADPDRHTNIISVKIKSQNLNATINQLESSFSEVFPGHVFNYQFLDKLLDQSYRTDRKLGTIFGVLAAISIIVASLGLFGLASFLARQRIKEIGIRKVNGARTDEILTMLNKDFVKWVLIAFVIATPVTWYVMDRWLQNFAYKTELSWWIFVLSGLLGLGVALVTVSYQSWKAATKNPVEALRYE